MSFRQETDHSGAIEFFCFHRLSHGKTLFLVHQRAMWGIGRLGVENQDIRDWESPVHDRRVGKVQVLQGIGNAVENGPYERRFQNHSVVEDD